MAQSILSEPGLLRPRVSVPLSRNRLLDDLLAVDASFLLPQIRVVRLEFNESLHEYGDSIEDVYFPLDSLVSALSIMEDGTTIEISMAGREEMVGLSALLGRATSRHWNRMCIGGSVARVSRTALDELFLSNATALKFIMRSYSSFITQVSQRAVCNARHTVLERLACWLLMVHDRVGGENLKLTQEAIASRLGARRAGITVAAGTLQSIGAIEYRRGHLHIRDRQGLEQAVCECYATLNADHEDLTTGRVPPRDRSKLSPSK